MRYLLVPGVAALTLVSACTIGTGSDNVQLNEQRRDSNVELDEGTAASAAVLDGGSGADIAASQEFYGAAPFAVVADADDVAGVARAASVAVATWTPLLLVGGDTDPAAVAAELDRLQVDAVLSVAGASRAANGALDGHTIVEAPSAAADLSALAGVDFEERVVEDPAQLVGEIVSLDPARPVALTFVSDEPPVTGQQDPEEPTAPTRATTEAATTAGGELPAHGRPSQPSTSLVFAYEALADHRGATNDEGVAESVGRVDVVAAAATARATGATVLALPAADPRASGESVAAVTANEGSAMYGLGSAFGTSEEFADRVVAARSVPELPGGGQLLYPGRRMIASYGHPGVPAMGILGEQDMEATLARTERLAQQYDDSSPELVIPALEIIVTVASASAGADNQYSNVSKVEDIRPWIEATRDSGTYVVLDLQPGRTDFLTQAKLFEELLLEPHVGLALDPEWRLRPNEVHLTQIGQVDAEEVNEVVDWLADLTEENNLPQKLLILHQFQQRMITNRDQLETGRDEVVLLVHADGHGAPGMKMDTWNALRQDLPDGVWLGWKNFYDEDSPTFTPEQTMAIEPRPWFVSYQ